MSISKATLAPLIFLGALSCAAVQSETRSGHAPSAAIFVPAPEHALLMNSIGEWEGTVTMIQPDGTEQAAPATETVAAVGPFWTRSDFNMPMGPHASYTGHGNHGYNPDTGQYISTWVDNQSSFIAHMVGNVNHETGDIVTHWMAPNQTGDMVLHESIAVKSADSYELPFFMEGVKNMTISMKRK